MALPKLNDVPMYTTVIPSTGKQVQYRPFLVKEQKVLLVAYESQDRKQIINAMLDTIESCTNNQVQGQKLSTFDVDYMFTQIRSKSAGEKATLNLKCESCQEETPFTVNLTEINVPSPSGHYDINLTDNIKIRMKYPTYLDVLENDKLNSETMGAEFMMEFMIACIESVTTNEEQIQLKDEPHEEKIEFIDSLNNEQFEKISEFVRNIPKVTQQVKVSCNKCGHSNDRTLEGMENFF